LKNEHDQSQGWNNSILFCLFIIILCRAGYSCVYILSSLSVMYMQFDFSEKWIQFIKHGVQKKVFIAYLIVFQGSGNI